MVCEFNNKIGGRSWHQSSKDSTYWYDSSSLKWVPKNGAGSVENITAACLEVVRIMSFKIRCWASAGKSLNDKYELSSLPLSSSSSSPSSVDFGPSCCGYPTFNSSCLMYSPRSPVFNVL